MSKRYDVVQPRSYKDQNGAEKTSWRNLGVAFAKDDKISILLDALPMPGPDGQAKLILTEPREQTQGQSRRPEPQRGQRRDLDDEVPF